MDYLKKNWNSQIKLVDGFEYFKGDQIPLVVLTHPEFIKIILYISQLYCAVLNGYKQDYPTNISKAIREEGSYYEQEGKLCVYLSVLTYCLLLHHNVTTDKSMRYVQGYYWHKTESHDPLVYLMGNEHAGTHAWICVDKAVIDMSIRQQELFFDFESKPYILGKVPDKLWLKGFSEPKKTINKYVDQFSKRLNCSSEEWVEQHSQQMQDLDDKTEKEG
ncbi:hypothetical protein PP175_25310 (plasmid) [Aneurinibacillus sp. Ricciae_BoGa-3]|uniref:hypothetical protein n=1 Tax=Aneurinibacillus sp. Ricciae_BoGa-3 TaxID=3022697 RepID=UPI00233FF42B|nr:hypothetical protein [Aneurinibacillus sp. Ricciae_BoGa-3]WCK57388.1 hypothetical protein PP175_25310 [Aneurinibacillus sp. Ricciae_BoGa-3]